MALPTFFIIGAGKAGTTSLHYYLGLHPEIQMSHLKEPNFFAGPENGKPYPMGRISSLEKYEALFDPNFAVRGEASPSYTSHPIRQGAPERIRTLIPHARLIYLVRDPVARTVSHYQHLVAIAGERRPLSEVLGNITDPQAQPETCYSLYAAQLECYLHHFPEEQIIVIDHADLLASRRETLRDLFRFLAVDDSFDSPHFDSELYRSTDRRTYPRGYEQIVGGVMAPLSHWIPRRARHAVRSSLERLFFPPLEAPALEQPVRAQLQALFAPDVERLRGLTGKAFPTWSV